MSEAQRPDTSIWVGAGVVGVDLSPQAPMKIDTITSTLSSAVVHLELMNPIIARFVPVVSCCPSRGGPPNEKAEKAEKAENGVGCFRSAAARLRSVRAAHQSRVGPNHNDR